MAEVKITRAELYRDSDGWRWRTFGGNGEKLAAGESYKNKADALAALLAHIPEDVQITEMGPA